MNPKEPTQLPLSDFVAHHLDQIPLHSISARFPCTACRRLESMSVLIPKQLIAWQNSCLHCVEGARPRSPASVLNFSSHFFFFKVPFGLPLPPVLTRASFQHFFGLPLFPKAQSRSLTPKGNADMLFATYTGKGMVRDPGPP